MTEDRLPRFRKPPISEVAFGVQFQGPALSADLMVRYFDRLKGRYPRLQFQPPLQPAFETFGPQAPGPLSIAQLLFIGSGNLPLGGPQMPPPRMWLSSEDGSGLIQLQQDRLFFNWRSGTTKKMEYPHFDALRSEFERSLDELESLVKSEGSAPIVANQCELLYVNPIPSSASLVPVSEPHRIFRTWSNQVGEEWRVPLEDLAFNARYRLLDKQSNPFGRLTVNLSSGWTPDNSTTFQLELMARGRPIGEGRKGIAEFHDEARRAIVQCFAAITTPDMHKIWERYQ